MEEYNLAIKSSVGNIISIDIYVQSHGHYKQEYIMLSALATCIGYVQNAITSQVEIPAQL